MTSPKRLAVTGGGAPPAYIEDVFSTYLYTGTGSDQTLTTGVDLSTYGGMIWSKRRSGLVENHFLQDTNRGLSSRISSSTTGAAVTTGAWPMNAVSTTGMTVSGVNYAAPSQTYASWTFRKQAKFFDVVTYTGNGVIGGRQIAHNLGSEPGCIIIKATSVGGTPAGWITPADWWVYHRGLPSPSNFSLRLNTTAAQNNSGGLVRTSTTFTVYGGDPASVIADNVNGVTYVAYLFAHNAGGFGLTGTDNVISCGSFTTDGSGNATVTLGYEPQWMITKASSQAEGWYINDTMRGFFASPTGAVSGLAANSSAAEAGTRRQHITATGFTVEGGLSASQTYIYIAIRRGPMKVPTSGTSVFSPVARTGTGASATINAGFVVDSVWVGERAGLRDVSTTIFSRMTGNLRGLTSSRDFAETSFANSLTSFSVQNGYSLGSDNASVVNETGLGYVNWNFQRAPGFFDVVCYTGTGANLAVSHNLSAVPELMFVKRRSSAGTGFLVYNAATGNTKYQLLTQYGNTAPVTSSTAWNNTTPTSTAFTVGTDASVNASAGTYIAYLFASCPGVSKVGSYTGTGTTKQIDCGFTGGARFVLIKRTDSTGDWYVWDSARGIVAGNDPYLLLNSTAAEVTSTDYIDTYSAGFEISSTAPAAINANGGTYIFLAIA